MNRYYAHDITGERFGRLVVVGRAYYVNSSHVYWECLCDCGNKKTVRSDHLKGGKITSCGCYLRQKRPEFHLIHNQTNSRLYYVWRNMLNRCYNKNVRSYRNYGLNGVKVCEQWRHDFGAFSKWAYENGYDPDANYGDCTIDRIDVYGDYCPENCRWVDLKIQAKNKRIKEEVIKGGKESIAE